MSDRILSRQFHATKGAEAWRVLPDGAFAFFGPDEDLVDPHGRLAPFWFEEMEDLRADGAGSIHLVVWVPWDEAESRLASGLAAGGRVIRHNVEEAFWRLADPAGNEVDIATTSAPDPAD